MKNVHLLPTDKSSRLYLHSENELQLRTNIIRASEDYLGSNQHIYITNDSEIKEGDWYFWQMTKTIQKAKKDGLGRLPKFNDGSQKIILTTDIDLIKDGVQSIDDGFLEWFVKNPSCEWVEVEKGYLGMGGFCKSNEIISKDKIHYKIIIPKEEPKQEYQSECICDTECRGFVNVKCKKSKQETLEEDLLDTAIQIVGSNNVITIREFLIKHKWQQDKKLYSEEEVFKLLKEFNKQTLQLQKLKLGNNFNVKEWFEQFKKK